MATSQKCTVRFLKRRRLRRKLGEKKTIRYHRARPSQNVLREEIVATDKVVEKQEDVIISDVLTVWQKKRQEEKLRFEECSVKRSDKMATNMSCSFLIQFSTNQLVPVSFNSLPIQLVPYLSSDSPIHIVYTYT